MTEDMIFGICSTYRTAYTATRKFGANRSFGKSRRREWFVLK
jgi:hypothetical protein